MGNLAILLLLAGCQDNKVAVYNTPPGARINVPVTETYFDWGEAVEFSGTVFDDQESAADLEILWSSSIDGVFAGSLPADSAGVALFTAPDLSSGMHSISLTATDRNGESGVDTITVQIGPGGDSEGTPSVVLVGPVDGDSYGQSETVTVVGTVSDNEQDCDTLDTTILSSRDGVLWSGYVASNCVVTQDLPTLSAGTHQISLTAEDQEGNVGSASAGIEVQEDASPQVNISAPAGGSTWYTIDTILLEGTVRDDVTDPANLPIEWTSDLQGVLASGTPDSAGYTAAAVQLQGGTHVITLSAVDEDSNVGSDSISVIVEVQNEACDGIDNNGDGQNNEDWMDTYEANNSMGAPFDLGEVDNTSFPWSSGGDSVTVAGLTLHEASDEDWFKFDVDDEIYDNAHFEVSISGLPSGMFTVLELYDMNGGGSLETSISGAGSLSITFRGDGGLFGDTGEDDWAVRIYTSNWNAGACTSSYTLEIQTWEDATWP